MVMDGAVVLYPSPAIGHLISMVELGKLLLKHYPSLSIKVLITTLPFNTGSTVPYINRVSATTTSITFHHLPTISLSNSNSNSSPHHETLAFEVLRLNNPYVHQALVSFSKNCTVRALIMDFFCTPALSVAVELKIPAYYFFTSGACVLDSFLYLPTIHRNTTKSLKDLNTNLEFPGLPPIPSADMAKPMLDRNDEAYEGFLNASNHLPKSAGIIVNTFELLEPRAIKTISDGLCVPDEPTPPLYCIGPLIAADNRTSGDGGSHDCLKWLNSQPSQSVVFLCFGSLGTKERGLVVKSWAPQVAVLNHDSVAGFVTHCGWNSALEAICAGVPMVAWPLYAEQRFNRVPRWRSELGELMDSEQGNSVRMQVLAMKAAAEAAMSEGGSSRLALSKFVRVLSLGRSLSHAHTHNPQGNGSYSPVPISGNWPPHLHGGAGQAHTQPPPFISPSSSSTPLPHSTLAPPLHTSATSPPPLLSSPSTTSPPYLSLSIPIPTPPWKPSPSNSSASTPPTSTTPSTPSHSPPPSPPSSLTCSVLLLSPLVPSLKSPPTTSSLLAPVALLASFIYQQFTETQPKVLKISNTLLEIPCLPPIPSSDVPKPMLVRTSREYECFIEFFSQMPNSEGIIVNTFESLESKALKAISDGLCLPDRRTPPIFCIGPLIASDDHRGGGDGNVHECLKWLDSQPSQSVVFLCFGSLGLFSVEQLKEVAVGLERSGQRFLWVVRSPPTEDKSKIFFATPDPDLDSLLPDGFLGRTKGRGFVVKSWAPQVEVLKHESVGGFVTHCGWNSVLEAVCAGVPMVAWPLYAEQRLNRVLLVEEMKLALTMNESENEFVMAIEVEKRIRELMESKEGKMVRDRAKAAGDNARAAMSEGGSSLAAVGKLVESMKRH
ncbi:UDP-glucosyl transferase 88A1 [Actinidia rufa]|uniref:UDP-glucosyl transferase 88A1 n=1 Tax=Actinidia rufa TaxID=165716 RepID=A0A7J0G6L2_9ERIC|nr:UDP-glucosyl transferase 88A1 [Actinidia rufa]